MKEVKEEEAVSEVIGTILVLAITIVLFAAIFFYVQQFPLANPSEQITVYPEISYNIHSEVLYENLTIKAGSILQKSDTYLIILINNIEHTESLNNIKIVSPYGNSSAYLEPGDVVMWNSSSIGITVPANSSINSILFYKPSNQVLWESKNMLSNQILISSLYAIPYPLQGNKSFEIVVIMETYDPNGTSVYLNLTSLYGREFNVSMSLYSYSGNSATFYYYGLSPNIIPKNSTAYVTASSDGVILNSELNLF
ncbi:MAG: type IV pilin N-terminal domain-containing protein [Thermoplasmatales archaeon]